MGNRVLFNLSALEEFGMQHSRLIRSRSGFRWPSFRYVPQAHLPFQPELGLRREKNGITDHMDPKVMLTAVP